MVAAKPTRQLGQRLRRLTSDGGLHPNMMEEKYVEFDMKKLQKKGNSRCFTSKRLYMYSLRSVVAPLFCGNKPGFVSCGSLFCENKSILAFFSCCVTILW